MPRSPRWRGALASAAVLVAAPLAGAQTAHAQSAGPHPPPYPPPSHCLKLTATTVRAGGRLGFHGTGFAPRQRVEADLKSFAVVLGTFRADKHGDVTGTVTIPRHTRSGPHTFELIARKPHRKCAAKIKVRHAVSRAVLAEPVNPSYDDGQPVRYDGQPVRAGLASTDSANVLALGGAAAGLIAAVGAAMLVVRRRRSS
ncbi:hypothetical protein [Streptomyces afghaniensis]|uniref:hypothetical protein n=1 Tax=Streptomyces afghaniensis TaxID=66865 RepID=UPI00278609D1|nr:hypothetical protein [Streptomyces afghaniensis]MDQ1020545.1 hypothetical protein [Streptomyces afghaniensis]